MKVFSKKIANLEKHINHLLQQQSDAEKSLATLTNSDIRGAPHAGGLYSDHYVSLYTPICHQVPFRRMKLKNFVHHIVVLHGGRSVKERREIQEQLRSIPAGEERLLLATGRYIGEGFDDARLDTLFLALPVSWKGTLVQYAGRLHRLHPGKEKVRIVDYVDTKVLMLARMFEKRRVGYRAMGYQEESRFFRRKGTW